MAQFTEKTKKAIARALRLILEDSPEYVTNTSVGSSAEAKELFRLRLAGLEREHFEVAFLDTQHKLIEVCCMFKGTVNASAVYPREILKKALWLNANAVILAHNHPSGVLDPSMADKDITARIKEVLRYVDVEVMDHIIVGNGIFSFAESGVL